MTVIHSNSSSFAVILCAIIPLSPAKSKKNGSLRRCAASAAISTRECTRCFKNTIHKTPFEYQMDYRLDMAEKMQKNTEEPILDIAMTCGFSNGAYFGIDL